MNTPRCGYTAYENIGLELHIGNNASRITINIILIIENGGKFPTSTSLRINEGNATQNIYENDKMKPFLVLNNKRRKTKRLTFGKCKNLARESSIYMLVLCAKLMFKSEGIPRERNSPHSRNFPQKRNSPWRDFPRFPLLYICSAINTTGFGSLVKLYRSYSSSFQEVVNVCIIELVCTEPEFKQYVLNSSFHVY